MRAVIGDLKPLKRQADGSVLILPVIAIVS